jgi:hypothetical protein
MLRPTGVLTMKYRSRGATSVAVLACLSLIGAGCNELVTDEPLDTVEQHYGPATPGEEHNGEWTLSELLDKAPYMQADEYFSVKEGGTKNGAPANVKFVAPASLAADGHAGHDPWFNGVILSSGYGIDVRINVAKGDAGTTHYKLEARTSPVAPFTLVCTDAIPLKGTFAANTQHLATPGRITFGCHDGAAHKCTMFEYPAGASPTAPLWDAHQACMGMVRAAYCSSGDSHTYNGTRIKFVDSVGVRPLLTEVGLPIGDWPPDPTVFRFEAAWTGDANQPVDCAGRVRWTSEQVGGLCDEELPDPRLHGDADECDGMTPEDMLAAGAVLISAVQANELGLHRWRRQITATTFDYAVTVRGYHDNTGRYYRPPFDAYGTYVYDDTDGFLLRAIPEPVPANPTVEVSTFREIATSRFVLARSNSTIFANNPAYEAMPEGYVFQDPGAGLAALMLWRNPTTGDYVSTVKPPPPGYTTSVGLIGYVRALRP